MGAKMEPKSMPEHRKNNAEKGTDEKKGTSSKIMFFWKGKNLILSVKHYTVVQKQGSRGSVTERCPYAKIMKNQ